MDYKKKFMKGKHEYVDWGHNVKEVRTLKGAPAQPQTASQQIQVEIDEATAQGVYANLASISHSESEFILDFLFLQPGRPGASGPAVTEGAATLGKAKVRARVISSPKHTKRFLAALSENVKKYEKQFGEI